MQIEIVDYDPAWPEQFAREADRVRNSLGGAALSIDHVGSTAVRGLAAKPVIDINLAVADSEREEAYAPALHNAGYRLVIREPDWHQHRMFNNAESTVNLHVFSKGCPEIERMKLFRDWLRANPVEATCYSKAKRALAARDWPDVQAYADAKKGIVAEIMERADRWRKARR